MQYAYPCKIIGNEYDGEGFAVTFPDVYGANSGGKTYEEALFMAEDCLLVALCAYVESDEDIPIPSHVREGQELITVPPLSAAKLALYSAIRRQEISKGELAERLGTDEFAVRQMLIPDRYSHMRQVARALDVVGCRLVVEDLAA